MALYQRCNAACWSDTGSYEHALGCTVPRTHRKFPSCCSGPSPATDPPTAHPFPHPELLSVQAATMDIQRTSPYRIVLALCPSYTDLLCFTEEMFAHMWWCILSGCDVGAGLGRSSEQRRKGEEQHVVRTVEVKKIRENDDVVSRELIVGFPHKLAESRSTDQWSHR